jgi:ABC-type transporter Mla subunit MlaD
MKASTSRVALNLGFLFAIAAGLVGYALYNWIGSEFFRPTYSLAVAMPDAGGVAPDQQVTVRGLQVGVVEDLELTTEGVDILLRIDGDEAVPDRAVVQVLRRSPIGEQAIDFIPVAPDWEPEGSEASGDRGIIPARVPVHADWEAAEPGSTIEPVAAVLPSSVPALLDSARELLAAVPGDDLATVIRELADAFGGRADVMRELNRDAAELGATLIDGIPEFERLIDSSGPVLEVLRDHRDALASSFTASADVSETLAANRPTLEAIIDDSHAALVQADALVRNERANVSCMINDLGTLNAVFAQDEQLERLGRLLDLNRYFYGGFDAGTQWDPYRPGIIWARVNILFFEEAGGEPYEPRRPTPATLPGEACVSPFGVGVNAVRQDDPQPPDPTSPGIDYAPRVDDSDQERRDPQAGTDGPTQGSPDSEALAWPSEPTPQTGAHPVTLLGAATLLAGAALAGRRRGRRPTPR